MATRVVNWRIIICGPYGIMWHMCLAVQFVCGPFVMLSSLNAVICHDVHFNCCPLFFSFLPLRICRALLSVLILN